MQMRRVIGIFVCTIAAIFLGGCKPSVPSKYISPDDLEDILYDYHLADAESNMHHAPGDTLRMRAFKAAILKKHGYTEEEFETSMVYYMRHSDRLYEVYEKLADRLSDEALSLGASMSEVNQYLSLNSTGDTANVWPGDRSFVLMQNPVYSNYSFSIKADTTYHPGDKMKLDFSTRFLFQDGSRDGIAVMALKLANDSVVSRMIHVGSSSRYSIQLNDDGQRGIKEIRGFFLLNHSPNASGDSQTTLKLMVVNDIQLIRFHASSKEQAKEEKDSVSNDTVKEVAKQPIRISAQ